MNRFCVTRAHAPLARLGTAALCLLCSTGLFAAAATNKVAKGATDKGAPMAKTPEAPGTNKPPAVVEIPKSEFTDKIGAGKDPFFPNSIRRLPVVPKPPTPPIPPQPPGTNSQTINVSTNVPTVDPPPPPPPKPKASSFLSLKGVFLGKAKSASISTTVRLYDMSPGDSIVVRLPDFGPVRIKCIEIKARSVIIEVEGEEERVELRLKTGL